MTTIIELLTQVREFMSGLDEQIALLREERERLTAAIDEQINDLSNQGSVLEEIEEQLMGLIAYIPAFPPITVGTFVAITGNDTTGDGSASTPYLTITKARDEIRLANNVTPIVMDTGDYYLAGTGIDLTSADNGLTITAQTGSAPVIHQGEEVTGAWNDEGGGLWSMASWTNACEDLFIDGVQAIRSRFPAWDGGDPYEAIYLTAEAVDSGADTVTHRAADGMPAFTDVTGMKMLYFNQPWASEVVNVTAYDSGTRKFTYTDAAWINPRVGGRFYIFDIPKQASKALTQGEFWYDSVGDKIWYMDSEFVGDGSEQVVAGQEVNFFALTGDGMTLDGLTLTSGAALHPSAPDYWANGLFSRSAITMIGADSNTVKNCPIYNVAGGVGVYSTSTGNTITLNSIYNVAGAAIGARSVADNLTVSENLIHHTGLIHRKDHAVTIEEALNVTVAHNEVHHSPGAGISVASNDTGGGDQVDGFVIEYNYVHDVGLETADVGGIYIRGVEFGDMGGTIRYNWVETMRARNTESDGSWSRFEDVYLATNDASSIGIYLDDFASGVNVYGNYIKDTGHSYYRHGGFENDFYENICINCGPFDHDMNNSGDWAGDDWNSVRNNIFHWEGAADQPTQVLSKINWIAVQNGVYTDLSHLLHNNNNYYSVDGFPSQFAQQHWTGTTYTFATWKTLLSDGSAQSADPGSITTDPSFVDLSVDGTLNGGSPALSAPVSIPQIPFSQIGIS